MISIITLHCDHGDSKHGFMQTSLKQQHSTLLTQNRRTFKPVENK